MFLEASSSWMMGGWVAQAQRAAEQREEVVETSALQLGKHRSCRHIASRRNTLRHTRARARRERERDRPSGSQQQIFNSSLMTRLSLQSCLLLFAPLSPSCAAAAAAAVVLSLSSLFISEHARQLAEQSQAVVRLPLPSFPSTILPPYLRLKGRMLTVCC